MLSLKYRQEGSYTPCGAGAELPSSAIRVELPVTVALMQVYESKS
jgi:hypothetical protein